MPLGKNILSDIRFWILAFFLVRLFGITNPPLEIGHNWRQTTVTMVARNFLEVDNDILYPRVDMAGEKTGITGMEFPVINYMIFAISELCGYEHWYGRLLNLIISSFGVWFFYVLIRKYFHENIAFPSAIILLVSIWFQYSRKIMPDTFSVSFIHAGMYFGTQYLDSSHRKYSLQYLIFSTVFVSIGVLAKLPSGYLLVVFVLFLADKSVPNRRKLLFSGLTLLAILPAAYWYFLWVPHLVERYGYWHFFMGQDLLTGFQEIAQNVPETLKKFYDSALKFVGFGVFLFGAFCVWKTRNVKLALIFFFLLLSFSVVVVKAGRTFVFHDYYIIPFVPIMALIAGYGIFMVRRRWLSRLMLLVISIEGIANQYHDFFIRDKEMGILQLESDLDKVSDRSDLILINSGNYPTPLYFAHRRGWVLPSEDLANPDKLDSLSSLGLKYVVVLKRTFGSEVKVDGANRVIDNSDYTIYRVR